MPTQPSISAPTNTGPLISSPPPEHPTYLSVATRNVPCTETPTPPPIVIPSISATCGFCSLAIR